MAGITGTRTPAVGVETSTAEPSSVSFFAGNDLSSVDDVETAAGQVATVFALLGAEGSFGVKGSADRLLPDLLPPAESLSVTWVGFPVAIAVALLVVPAGVRGLLDAGLVRTNYRGASLAFPLGAVLATAALVALAPLAFLNDRADLDLLSPGSAPVDALPARRRLPRLPRRLAGAGRGGGRAARLARPRAGAARRQPLDRRGQGAWGRWRSPPTWSPAAGSNRGATSPTSALLILATNLFNLLDLRPGRAEKGLALLGGRALPRRLDLRAAGAARHLRRPGAGRRRLHPARAGDARRHRLQPARRRRRGLAADDFGRPTRA